MRIGVVAPSTPIQADTAERVTAIAAALYPDLRLDFHPQCFLVHKHFAGDDAARADAFAQVANDPAYDALWFARGGYGSCRIAEAVLARLEPAARAKTYLGYSDAGFLLAGLDRAGFPQLAHGPMPNDVWRDGGEAAVVRALRWMVERSPDTIEPGLVDGEPAIAFNLTVFSQLIGTPLQPDVAGRVLLLEEVSEYMYRIDRSMFHVTSNPAVRQAAGIRLGRCDPIPENAPDFGESEEDVARHWCARSGIVYLGRADIGHDSGNHIVPFVRRSTRREAN